MSDNNLEEAKKEVEAAEAKAKQAQADVNKKEVEEAKEKARASQKEADKAKN